jgi:hypothetical protein
MIFDPPYTYHVRRFLRDDVQLWGVILDPPVPPPPPYPKIERHYWTFLSHSFLTKRAQTTDYS